MEKTPAEGVSIHPNGVALQLQQPDQSVTGQLLIDCMGNFSPIVRQVRLPVILTSACPGLQLPDQICLAAVVQWQADCAIREWTLTFLNPLVGC